MSLGWAMSPIAGIAARFADLAAGALACGLAGACATGLCSAASGCSVIGAASFETVSGLAGACATGLCSAASGCSVIGAASFETVSAWRVISPIDGLVESRGEIGPAGLSA